MANHSEDFIKVQYGCAITIIWRHVDWEEDELNGMTYT